MRTRCLVKRTEHCSCVCLVFMIMTTIRSCTPEVLCDPDAYRPTPSSLLLTLTRPFIQLNLYRHEASPNCQRSTTDDHVTHPSCGQIPTADWPTGPNIVPLHQSDAAVRTHRRNDDDEATHLVDADRIVSHGKRWHGMA